MLTILGWLFIGFFVGSIGQVFRPDNEPETIDRTVLIGVCGAFIGGLIGGSPFKSGQGNAGFVISLALAVLGSLAVLFIYHLALSLNVAGFLSVWASLIKDRRPLARNYQTAMIQQLFQTWKTSAAPRLISMNERTASELFRVPGKIHCLLMKRWSASLKPRPHRERL